MGALWEEAPHHVEICTTHAEGGEEALIFYNRVGEGEKQENIYTVDSQSCNSLESGKCHTHQLCPKVLTFAALKTTSR
jgi:hypothetical protein